MKKAMILILALLVCAGCFLSGRMSGIKHAIEDSVIWTVTCYNPESPEESAWNGYDQQIFIDLDGNLYEHGMIQG